MSDYSVPIWLSDWVFIDSRKIKHHVEDVVFAKVDSGVTEIVDKVVKKIIGTRKKHTLKPINLHLKSQHGFGVEEN